MIRAPSPGGLVPATPACPTDPATDNSPGSVSVRKL